LAGARGLIAQASGDMDVFGVLQVYTGAFDPNHIDHRSYFEQGGGPRVVIYVQRQSASAGFVIRSCSIVKTCLDHEANRIRMLNRTYEVLGPNSNTFTSTMLTACGLPRVIPFDGRDLVTGSPGWNTGGLE